MLNDELKEPSTYNAIIESIATGANKVNEIASRLGKPASQLTSYIANLLTLKIISKKQPLGEEHNKKKTIYTLSDNLFRFSYRFVRKNSWLIEKGQGELLYERIQPLFSEYFGHIFEDISRTYLETMNFQGKLPSIYTASGSWWGRNPKKKTEEEIDIVLADDEHILVAECKWQNEITDVNYPQDKPEGIGLTV